MQSFYERISTLIERSSAYLAPASAAVAVAAPAPVAAATAATAPATTTASTPPPPPPSYSPPSQAEKEADTPDDTTHTVVDTSAPAADPPTDMVSFFLFIK